ncbi:MAG: carbohydrate deacetylase, partial [Coprobacillus sp.]
SFQDVSILKDEDIVTNDILIDPWCSISEEFKDSHDKLNLLITSIRSQIEKGSLKNDVIEVMWHPAYLDINIMTGSSFAYPRIYEVEAIQNQELIKYIKENFELCTFQDI